MTRSEKLLRVLLRIVGSSALLAAPCAMMPYAWMDAVHEWLGLGELPAEPVVGYLARSTSAFYAVIGGLLWVVSFDLRRHRVVLYYLGAAHVLFGLFLVGVDLAEGMPWWWTVGEGPPTVGFGLLILALVRGLGE